MLFGSRVRSGILAQRLRTQMRHEVSGTRVRQRAQERFYPDDARLDVFIQAVTVFESLACWFAAPAVPSGPSSRPGDRTRAQ